jgi:hypothetical protein
MLSKVSAKRAFQKLTGLNKRRKVLLRRRGAANSPRIPKQKNAVSGVLEGAAFDDRTDNR